MHVDPNHEGFWNLILQGHKRWVLLSGQSLNEVLQKDPGIRERWNLNSHGWYEREYPKLVATGVKFEECVVNPGEMIYGPPGWYHVVLGVESSVSVSEQLVTRENIANFAKIVLADLSKVRGCMVSHSSIQR